MFHAVNTRLSIGTRLGATWAVLVMSAPSPSQTRCKTTFAIYPVGRRANLRGARHAE